MEIRALFQRLAGVLSMVQYVLLRLYFTLLTDATFLLPYFIASVKVVLKPLLTCISHLNLQMDSCLS